MWHYDYHSIYDLPLSLKVKVKDKTINSMKVVEQNADPDLHQSLYYGDAPAIQNCVWGYYAQSNARGATAKELPRC